MEKQEHLKKSKVIKIDSKESWEHYISYATNQNYPVSLLYLTSISLYLIVAVINFLCYLFF